MERSQIDVVDAAELKARRRAIGLRFMRNLPRGTAAGRGAISGMARGRVCGADAVAPRPRRGVCPTTKRAGRGPQHRDAGDELSDRRAGDTQPGQGRVSVRWGNDYHDYSRSARTTGRLRSRRTPQTHVRGVVDTAPLSSGNSPNSPGWAGSARTRCYSTGNGELVFSGGVVTDVEFEYETPRNGSLRNVPGMPRCLPDQRLCRSVCARCSPVHQLFHDRTALANSARTARRHGRLGVRLRRLPGRLPLEPPCAAWDRKPASSPSTE